MNGDLYLIGGDFVSDPVPKEKKYLYKYFTTDMERAFLRYYYRFRHMHRFVAHTGRACSRRWRTLMRSRLDSLEKVHDAARAGGDIEGLTKIESGSYPLPRTRPSD